MSLSIANAIAIGKRKGGGGQPKDPLNGWEGLRLTALEDSVVTYTPSTVSSAEYTTNGNDWQPFVDSVSIKKNLAIGIRGTITANQTDTTGYQHYSFDEGSRIKVSGKAASLFENGDGSTKTLKLKSLCHRLFYQEQGVAEIGDLQFNFINSYWGSIGDSVFAESGVERVDTVTIKGFCSKYMFRNCTKLSNKVSIFIGGSFQQGFEHFFQNTQLEELVVNLTQSQVSAYVLYNFCNNNPKLKKVLVNCSGSLGENGLSTCFNNNTLLETIYFRATTITSASAFNYALRGCSKIKDVYLDVYSLSEGITSLTNWLNSTNSSGTIHKKSSVTLPSGSVSGIPTGWTVIDDLDGASFVDANGDFFFDIEGKQIMLNE